MTTKTTLGQLGTAELDTSGAVKFKIKTSLDYLNPGDLPYEDVFVHQIVVTNDPKSDKFLRVANIVDLTVLPRGRDAALVQSSPNYLSADFTVQYDDVITAAAAKTLIQSRVDSIISDWKTYQTQFILPASYELPAVDSTVVKAAKSNYATAKKKREDADTALVSATDNVTDAQAAATAAAQAVTDAQARVLTCTQNLALLNAGVTAASTFRTVVTSFESVIETLTDASDLFAAQATSFEASHTNSTFHSQIVTFSAALTAFENAYSGIGGFKSDVSAEQANAAGPLAAAQTAFATECTNEQTALVTLRTAKQAADAAYGSAQTAQALAQAAADQARLDESAALASLVTVCPDFDPASP